VVHVPQPETCKACISSWPTPSPAGCTCLCHLTNLGVLGGSTSPVSPCSNCFPPPPPNCKAPPSVSSREPPSPLGALRSPEIVKPSNSALPHLHPGAPHPALRRASPATCGNPLSSRSGTVSRPRPKPPRNRTGPGRARVGVESSLPPPPRGGNLTPDVHPDFKSFESARELLPPGPLGLVAEHPPLMCPPAPVPATPPHLRLLLSSPCNCPGGAGALTHARTGPGRLSNGWAGPLRSL
jgi:hypothetical protein